MHWFFRIFRGVSYDFPMNYTLKQLRYFAAAGETGSVTKAAALVHVSQPSISAAVAHLEQVFGLKLFIRHHAQGGGTTDAANSDEQNTRVRNSLLAGFTDLR